MAMLLRSCCVLVVALGAARLGSIPAPPTRSIDVTPAPTENDHAILPACDALPQFAATLPGERKPVVRPERLEPVGPLAPSALSASAPAEPARGALRDSGSRPAPVHNLQCARLCRFLL